MKKGFLKFSDERNKKYSIKTEIDFSSENKSVVKKAVYEEGKAHLAHIVEAGEKLKTYFSKVEICPVKEVEDGIAFEFCEGELMLNRYLQLMQANDKAGYEKLLQFHKSIICGDDNNKCEFKSSKEFEEWFGDGSGYEGSEGLVYSNFDAIAGNIILRENVPVFIDYEWTLDFIMPKDLVVYHCIYDAYIHNQGLEVFYPMKDVLELLDIRTSIELLETSYRRFFEYVICEENGLSYAKDKFKCLKPVYSVPYIVEQYLISGFEWERVQEEIDYARTEWEKCAGEWKKAVEANAQLDQELKHAHSEWQKCADEWKHAVAIVDEITKAHQELSENYNRLSEEYNAIINSKVWRINTKLRNIVKK